MQFDLNFAIWLGVGLTIGDFLITLTHWVGRMARRRYLPPEWIVSHVSTACDTERHDLCQRSRSGWEASGWGKCFCTCHVEVKSA